jgi:hypothetical protein
LCALILINNNNQMNNLEKKQPTDFRELTNQHCEDCGKPLKKSLIEQNPNAKRCWGCHKLHSNTQNINRDKFAAKKAKRMGLISMILLFMFQLISAQSMELLGTNLQTRNQNDNGSWGPWIDQGKCNVPILISPTFNTIRIVNALDQTFSINDNGPNQKWYESEDYEGRHMVIVVQKDSDSTYTVRVQYQNIRDKKTKQLLVCGYCYRYPRCKIIQVWQK